MKKGVYYISYRDIINKSCRYSSSRWHDDGHGQEGVPELEARHLGLHSQGLLQLLLARVHRRVCGSGRRQEALSYQNRQRKIGGFMLIAIVRGPWRVSVRGRKWREASVSRHRTKSEVARELPLGRG
jgi:hypothetical protein